MKSNNCSLGLLRRIHADPLKAVFLALNVALTGCGVHPPTAGLEPGNSGRFQQIAFVPLLADEARLEWSDGLRSEAGPRQMIGWDTRTKAGRIAAELMAETGTPVTPLADVAGLLPDAQKEPDWARHVWQRLKSDDRLRQPEALVVLRQNAVDANGRQYNPVSDFLAFGIVGVIAGAAGRDDRFQPSFLVALNAGLQDTMVGPSRCSIGFDARLLDFKTGNTLAATDAILGQEYFPANFRKKSGIAMDKSEQEVAETYCIAALRRGISQALQGLNLTRER